MKKYILILLLLFQTLFAKESNFILISNIRIGAPKADSLFLSFIRKVNADSIQDFVIIAGDITDKGQDKEFEKAKALLDSLKHPYFVIPGYRDEQWAQSGGLKFIDLWERTNFSYDSGGLKIIGINTTPVWRAENGHISPETFEWLKDETGETDQKIILVSFYPFEKIDNREKLLEALKGKNVVLNLYGDKYSVLQSPLFLSKQIESFYDSTFSYKYTECKIKNDSLFLKNTKDTTSIGIEDSLISQGQFSNSADTSSFIPYAVNPLWRKELRSTMVAEPLILKDKIILAFYDGLVSCYDKEGKEIWDFDSFGNIVSTPAVKDNYLAVATLQGDLITLNAKTGDEIQSIGFDEPITSSLLMIDYKGKKDLMIPKQTDSKAAVIFGTATGKLYCYDVETLQEYWENKSAKGMIQTAPLYFKGKLIYGAWDSFLYCVDARKGWLIWKWSMDKSFFNSTASVKPVTDGRFVYTASPNGNIYKIDPLLGKTIWTSGKFNAWKSLGISTDKKTLFVKSRENFFHKVPTKTGRWSIAFNLGFGKDKTATTPIEYNKIIFVTTAVGNVYRIKGKKYKAILFNGKACPFSTRHFYRDTFVSSNIDGTITLFGYYGD